jgi:hypothetical protein
MMRGDAAADDDDDVHALSVSCACVCVEREERERERETEREPGRAPPRPRPSRRREILGSQQSVRFLLATPCLCAASPPAFFFFFFCASSCTRRLYGRLHYLRRVQLGQVPIHRRSLGDLWCLSLAASRPVAHQKPVEAWPAPPFETPADGLTGTPSPPCHPPPSLPTTGVVSLVASSRSTTPASASCPSQMRQDVSAGSPPFPRSLRHRIHPHRCRFAPTCACPPPPVRPFPSAPRTASPRRRPTPPPRGRPRQIPCR